MNAPTFNLVDEPWIPVEDSRGTIQEVSLMSAFLRASEWRRVVDPSPLVTAALYRLLFAVYHRAALLRDDDDWTDAWEDLDVAAPAETYLRQWHHRFDLFDPVAPFWQTIEMPEDKCLFPWTKLAIELPPNTSKLLFDHTVSVEPPAAEAGRVARAMAACQAFTVGAGKSCLGYTSGAPLASALVVVPEGRNLAETIVANANPTAAADDRPVWEAPPLTAAGVEAQLGERWRGVASRLTWPARAVRLIPLDHTGRVKFIRFAMGLRVDADPSDRDPWVSYHVTKEGTRRPRRLDPSRMVWRDLHGMMHGAVDGTDDPVLVLSRLDLLKDTRRTPPRAWSLLVAGHAADKARVDAWRQERWGVPPVILADGARASAVADAIHMAERTHGLVRKYAWRLAADMLTTSNERRPDRTDVASYVGAMPTHDAYWAPLEPAFATFLQLLAGDVDVARSAWRSSVAGAVRDAARAAHAALGKNARALRAWARSGWHFDALAARIVHGDVTKAAKRLNDPAPGQGADG